MSGEEPQSYGQREPRAAALASIKSMAFGAVIGALLCLYFGFAWTVDAPPETPEEAAATWYAVDHGFRWALRIVGVLFLLVAGLTAMAQPAGALLAAATELLFGLVLAAMTIEGFIEDRVSGMFDFTVIILAVVAFFGFSAARRSWRIYRQVASLEVRDTPL